MEGSLLAWRRSLPPEMRIENVQEWTPSKIWIFVLMAMSYHLECILYRTVRKRGHEDTGTSFVSDRGVQRQKQQNAMFELDTIIKRVVLLKLSRLCPLSL